MFTWQLKPFYLACDLLLDTSAEPSGVLNADEKTVMDMDSGPFAEVEGVEPIPV